MLFTNVECSIKTKTGQVDKNDYRYIEFGTREKGLFFLPCAIKGFDTINAIFHSKLSIGKSKKDNPKIVYNTEDKDLYMLLKSEPNENLFINIEDQDNIEVVQLSKVETEDDNFYTMALVKVIEDAVLVFDNEKTKRFLSVKNKYVKMIDSYKELEENKIALLLLTE